MTMSIVSGRDIAISYGARHVLEGVDLSLAPGRFVAMIGPNGGGKSSLLRVLAGTQAPTAGHVVRTGRVALVAPSSNPPGDLTPFDLASYGLASRRKFWQWSLASDDAMRVRDALARCELSERANDPVALLSAGEVQRTWIAAALATAPDVLLVDEPTTHLDLKYQLAVLQTLRELARAGVAIVAAIHDLTLAGRLADEVALVAGCRLQCGPPDEILERRALSDAFGISVSTYRHPQDGYLVCLPS